MLSECLAGIAGGRMVKVPQTGGSVPAPRITSADTWLDFSGPAGSVRNLVRGLACGPRARFGVRINGRQTAVQALRCSLVPSRPGRSADAGIITAIEREKGFVIQCGDGELLMEEVQPEGKKPMRALDFINGARLKPGDKVGGIRDKG